ncbi:hypothetical protein [Sphingobium sp. B10D7B]|uniref:hypothetical protein n=1 Tax=Sphingobium sp. B10D7B TaxID=2940573 RepID=UPI0022259965|nr:hypothetical protein [Sphingobium sp. B10D7B]
MDWLTDSDEPQTPQAGHWSVQPMWAKLYTVCVGFPAWAFLMFGDFGGLASYVAMGVFTAAVLIQMAYVLRRYWRMDI